jgi:hypothetical protein
MILTLPDNQYKAEQQESSLQKGAFVALQRAALEAREVAIQTNTAIIVLQDGVLTRITADELKKQKKLICS